MALEMVLRRMKIEDATVHGFRSAFRDWAAECTNFTNEVCEAALAHVIENKAEAAYRRGDLFEKRRKLMEAWAVYWQLPKPKGCGVQAKAVVSRQWLASFFRWSSLRHRSMLGY